MRASINPPPALPIMSLPAPIQDPRDRDSACSKKAKFGKRDGGCILSLPFCATVVVFEELFSKNGWPPGMPPPSRVKQPLTVLPLNGSFVLFLCWVLFWTFGF